MNSTGLAQAAREDALRAQFQAAAARGCQSAAKVMRGLMEAYIAIQDAPEASPMKLRGSAVSCAAAAVLRVTGRQRADADGRDVEALVKRQYGWKNSEFGEG